MIQILVKKSKVNKRITAHAFRRSFATFHSRLGTKIENICELMGHENINTTKGYIRIDQSDLRKLATPTSLIRGVNQ